MLAYAFNKAALTPYSNTPKLMLGQNLLNLN